jgi:ATPase subunit of ABC transporter with duplicated ATPase domains
VAARVHEHQKLLRLFCKSANVLVMKVPTNDLDVETLELQETPELSDNGPESLLVCHMLEHQHP